MKKILLSLTLLVSAFTQNASPVNDLYSGKKLYTKSNHKNDYLPKVVVIIGSKAWDFSTKILGSIASSLYQTTVGSSLQNIAELTTNTQGALSSLISGDVSTIASSTIGIIIAAASTYYYGTTSIATIKNIFNMFKSNNVTTSHIGNILPDTFSFKYCVLEAAGIPSTVLFVFVIGEGAYNKLKNIFMPKTTQAPLNTCSREALKEISYVCPLNNTQIEK